MFRCWKQIIELVFSVRAMRTCRLGCACLGWAAMSPTSKLLRGKFSVRTATYTASPSVSSTGPSFDAV
jgi:hypothetical protein